MTRKTLDEHGPQDVKDPDTDGCDMGDKALDSARSQVDLNSVDAGFNDIGPPIDVDIDDLEDEIDAAKQSHRDGDHILEEIKESIVRRQSGVGSEISSQSGSESSPQVKVSSQFLSVPYGIIPRATYEHGKRSSDIMGATYNGRMRQFVILDSKGITTWKRDAVDHRVSRALSYPKYEYRLITNVVYAKKYNCYFILGKDFSLKVLNRDFFETCSVSADLRSVLFMLFNPVRDELITGGVGGTKVWRFHQQPGKAFAELRPLANYGLTLKYELPNVGGSWVKRVELDHHLEHLYCCSDTDLHVYDLGGKLLFKFERAHMMSITGCRYSRNASVLITSSIDCEVKVWSLMGGLVHTFRGHSRAVTNLILHPATSSIVITCSLDGTVRMWSLDTMDCFYSLVVSVDGVMWMGLTDDNLLYLSTPRAVTLWNLNYSVQFWALSRSKVTKMALCGCKDKTTRLMAISEESSVRLMARKTKKNLTTVLPPPSISPLQRVLSVCYSREFNAIYILINPQEIWVYTTRTDPCCRIAVWDVIDVQSMSLAMRTAVAGPGDCKPAVISVNKPTPTHRATENGAGNEALANCCCLAILNSTAVVWTDEGYGCPIRDSYLLLGLEDGRILFMDPVVKGHKYLEFKTGKDPVLDIYHDVAHNSLITLYKLANMMQIHVWSLPDLELQHEVYTAADLRAYARVGYTMVTGHDSGCVLFHSLEHATDPGLNKGRMIPAYEDVIDISRKPEHFAPVIAVDVCVPLKIFCSCSNDGAIKIWNDDNVLMTEIMLDSSVSSICFLNNLGDLVVGYQKHIFFIDHTKVCPQLTVTEEDIDSCEKESYICEDPAVLYEGVTPNPDPVTLDSYLVPFDIEFSKDFLEGRVQLEPEPVQEEESDGESEVSMAPTEVYLSPASTPRRCLSLIDLTLGSEVSKYDLLKHMKKTLDHLAEKEKREAAQIAYEQKQKRESKSSAYQRQRRRQIRRGEIVDDADGKELMKKDKTEDDVGRETDEEGMLERFSFPKFGTSPGPTPESSRSASPEGLSEVDEMDQTVDVTEESVEIQVKLPVVQVVKKEEDEISRFIHAEEEQQQTSGKSTPDTKTPRKKFGLSEIRVDASALMKDVKKSPAGSGTPRRKPQTEVVKKTVESDSDEGEIHKRVGRKEKLKKKMMSPRKHPRQKKSEKLMSDKLDAGEGPPTQMQALSLVEKELSDVDKLSTDMEEQQKAVEDQSKFDESSKMDNDLDNRLRPTTPSMKISVTDGKHTKGGELSVPDLPVVPSDSEGGSRPSSSKSRLASTTKPKHARAPIDFGSPGKKVGVVAGMEEMQVGDGAGAEGSTAQDAESRAVNVDSAIAMEDGSVVSAGSEAGRASFRAGAMSKEDTSGMEDGTSLSFAAKKGKSQLLAIPETAEKSGVNVKECRRDSSAGKETIDKGALGRKVSHSKKPPGKFGSKLTIKPRPKSSRKTTTEKPAAENPEQLLSAYFEKQKEKAAQKDAPKIMSPSEAEELLKLASSGKKRPLTPEDAGQMPSAMSNVDPRSLMPGGVTSTPTGDLKSVDSRAATPDLSILRATTPSLNITEIDSVRSTSPTLGVVRDFSSPVVQASLATQKSDLSAVSDSSASGRIPVHDKIGNREDKPLIPGGENRVKIETKTERGKNIAGSVTVSPSDPNKTEVESTVKINAASLNVGSGQNINQVDAEHQQGASSYKIKDEGFKATGKATAEHLPEKVMYGGRADMEPPEKSVSLKSKDQKPDAEKLVSGKKMNISDAKGEQYLSTESVGSANIKPGVSESVTSDGKSSTPLRAAGTENSESDTTPPPVKKVEISYHSSKKRSERLIRSIIIEDITEETEEEEVDGDGRMGEEQKVKEIQGEEMKNGKSISNSKKDDTGGTEEREQQAIETEVEKQDQRETETQDVEPEVFESPKETDSDRSWDSDFDQYSPSVGSVGSLISSSSQSAEDSKDGTASSSSDAEPLMRVKIRKKPWSHYRIKKQVVEDASPRRESQQGASLQLRRKFSQNDALTVQRNAYLEGAKTRTKRAQSAIEGSNQLRAQQLREKMVLKISQRSTSSISQCVLCAAEGAHSHANHSRGTSEESAVKGQKLTTPRSRASTDNESKQLVPSPRSGIQPEAGDSAARDSAGNLTQTDRMGSPTISDMWTTPRGKTETPLSVETNDPSITRPSSQVFSEISNQPISASPEPRSEQPEDDEPRFGSEVISETQDEMDESERQTGSPESGWLDRDLISVSRQQVRSTDESGLVEDGSQDMQSSAQGLTEDCQSVGEMKETLVRPFTSMEDQLLEKPELQEAIKYFRQRPRTAEIRFQTEDLQTAFDTSLLKYRGMARSQPASDQLYKNDDQGFSEHWHERQIERHMLIRMQKELRAQNALKKRELMQHRKQEKWAHHISESHLAERRGSMSYLHPTSLQRASTVHGTRPTMNIPAPTPVSSRPQTATGTYGQQLQDQTQQQLMMPEVQTYPPPLNFQQQLQQTLERRAWKQEMELELRGKSELGHKKAFRCRMRQPQGLQREETAMTSEPQQTIDPWLLDPRNPYSVRPKSSKSIPSKCHQYVLVTKPKLKLNFPLPTPLEEQLLASRFPEQGMKVFKKYEGLLFRPPRRPYYGIEYSPYEHQLYG